MIRLYYLSKAADGIDDDDYQSILETSRRRNLVSGVTGLLLIKRGYFAQALEGEREFVDPLFKKIRTDHRHTNVEILSREEGVDTRIFPTWAIGYRNLNICDAPPKVGDVDMVDFLRSADPYQLGVFFRAFLEDSLAEAL
ncbi:MAG: BLUF domain-containing protein [Planctomycetota bacterium]